MAKGASFRQPSSPLNFLQSEYSFLKLSGEMWILEKAQLKTSLSVGHPSELHRYVGGPRGRKGRIL
jgi:hypothetical protein